MAIVIIWPRANADVEQVAAWQFRNVSQRAADRWLAGIERVIAALTDNADRYPEADEAADLGLDLRCKLHGRRPNIYRILFTIDGDTVNVLRVRHAAQDTLADDDL